MSFTSKLGSFVRGAEKGLPTGVQIGTTIGRRRDIKKREEVQLRLAQERLNALQKKDKKDQRTAIIKRAEDLYDKGDPNAAIAYLTENEYYDEAASYTLAMNEGTKRDIRTAVGEYQGTAAKQRANIVMGEKVAEGVGELVSQHEKIETLGASLEPKGPVERQLSQSAWEDRHWVRDKLEGLDHDKLLKESTTAAIKIKGKEKIPTLIQLVKDYTNNITEGAVNTGVFPPPDVFSQLRDIVDRAYPDVDKEIRETIVNNTKKHTKNLVLTHILSAPLTTQEALDNVHVIAGDIGAEFSPWQLTLFSLAAKRVKTTQENEVYGLIQKNLFERAAEKATDYNLPDLATAARNQAHLNETLSPRDKLITEMTQALLKNPEEYGKKLELQSDGVERWVTAQIPIGGGKNLSVDSYEGIVAFANWTFDQASANKIEEDKYLEPAAFIGPQQQFMPTAEKFHPEGPEGSGPRTPSKLRPQEYLRLTAARLKREPENAPSRQEIYHSMFTDYGAETADWMMQSLSGDPDLKSWYVPRKVGGVVRH